MSERLIDLTGAPDDPRPQRIVVGVGSRRGVSMTHLRTALAESLAASGGRTRDITAVVTVDGKQNEPALLELCDVLSVPLSTLPAEELARQQVPNPSAAAARAVGTPSVAEAAVLAAGAALIAPKYVGTGVTIALGVLPPVAAPGQEPPTRALALQGIADQAYVDLDHHGDAETAPGLADLAVNVRPGGPPVWLADRMHKAIDRIGPYPDQSAAVAAVAARHGRPAEQVLLTNGGAEAFVLLARALAPRYAVVVHPQFTEPEAALLAAGHDVHRLELEPPFVLDPARVPEQADLVIVGNPTNPTSVLHPAAALLALVRPGRVLVVDEAFMDAVTGPGQAESLAGAAADPAVPGDPGLAPASIPGLVVIRSLTKTWGLAGLRIGYLLGDPDVLSELAGCQPLWPVNTIALEAAVACSEPEAVREAAAQAQAVAADRAHLVRQLELVPGVRVVPGPQASFVLFQVPDGPPPGVHARLRAAGWAVRRADTFPGLGPGWLRAAVRDRATTDAFVHALVRVLHT